MVGVSPSSIRSWESLGLTRPQRTESKYRLYSREDVRAAEAGEFSAQSAGHERAGNRGRC